MLRRTQLSLVLAFALATGCSSPEQPSQPTPTETTTTAQPIADDWTGPPVHASFLADGSLRIVLTAPTGGHAFAVRSVDVANGRATVLCAHTPPTPDAIVTQVVTELAVLVESAKFPAGLREVTVVCSTRSSDGQTILREVWKQTN
jgi:hypothetical protein